MTTLVMATEKTLFAPEHLLDVVETSFPNLILFDWEDRYARQLGIHYLLCRISQGRSASIFVGYQQYADSPEDFKYYHPLCTLKHPANCIRSDLLRHTELLY